MTSRIPRWQSGDGEEPASRRSEGEGVDVGKDVRTGRESQIPHILADPVVVTEGMVDEAVARVVQARGIRPDAAEALKATMGRDTSGAPMHAYYSAKAAATRARMVGVGRKDLTLRYVLDDEGVQQLTDYAPELRLRFHSVESHDHAMAAATRIIDNRLIFSRLPEGVPFSDIGGNPMTYIRAGRRDWHVCGPVVDVKDPMRHKMRKMEARQIARGQPDTDEGRLASKFLESDETLTCGKKAQQCTVQTPIGVAVHVYDIPMADWPLIMEKKSLSVVEGCLLFSPRFFEQTEGVLGVSRARFEIDVGADVFRMGFSSSPSWWYEHKFSDYILYGTDQLIMMDGVAYSYKVIERRGDTLFFRILRVSSDLGREKRVVSYKTPGVPVVKVHGFALEKKGGVFSSTLEKCDYFFPKNLWGEMVAQAAEDFERGVMDFNKMYNHYRTISVRHTINAVLVMGGEQVSADELVPLVVHSCLAAAAQSLIGQRTTRAITEVELRRRVMRSESTVAKISSALLTMVGSVLLLPFAPLRMLGDALKDLHYRTVDKWVMDWEPVCEVVSVEAALLLATGSVPAQAISADTTFKRRAVDTAPFDHYAAVVANRGLAEVARKICPQLEIVSPGLCAGESKRDDGGVPSTVPPSYKTDAATVKPAGQRLDGAEAADVAAVRVAAIREHIEEATLQNRALAYTCGQAYRDLSTRGEPNKAALIKKAELFRNPDFWRVENGVIVESVLGLEPESFTHSAVYYPVPDSDTGDTVRAVFRSDWSGAAVHGSKVENKNFVLADTAFSGWVLTTDDLVVFNGPEIIGAMQKAIPLVHDYFIKLYWGPPGCGKTYSIVHEVSDDGTDAIMCPVRESIEDTRGEVMKLFPGFDSPKRYVRTVDSYLVNFSTDKKTARLKVDRLLADECFMAHAGKWYAAAALLGVESLWAYGDDFQIPHIPRVQAPKLHVKIRFQDVHREWITRRCPATAVAAWGSVYDWKVRTLSKEKGEMVEVVDTRGREVPQGCIMMCMYQADKRELKKLYAADIKRIKILTAHESEGKTFDHVWLHRFDQRKRNDKFSLFDQEPHVLVAMSRHRKTFVYRCPAPLDDLVSRWVRRSSDPRRIAAAFDVDSKGGSVEKL